MADSEGFVSDVAARAPGPEPLSVLNAWYQESLSRRDPIPDAMTLATASKDGRPSARVVLFKGIQRGGVFFVTSYRSRKARELAENPHAALVMHFPLLERQVRLEGRVERASDAESDAYFRERPRGSQLGAWASPQSAPIASRAELDALAKSTEERFAGSEVTRPDFWGGYLGFPRSVGLWLGRPDRLHDRFVYRRASDSEPWTIERLA